MPHGAGSLAAPLLQTQPSEPASESRFARLRRLRPCKLFVHLSTIALASLIFLTENEHQAHVLGELHADLAKIFYPPSCIDGWEQCDRPRCFILPDCFVSDVAQAQAMVAQVVTSYRSLRKISLAFLCARCVARAPRRSWSGS